MTRSAYTGLIVGKNSFVTTQCKKHWQQRIKQAIWFKDNVHKDCFAKLYKSGDFKVDIVPVSYCTTMSNNYEITTIVERKMLLFAWIIAYNMLNKSMMHVTRRQRNRNTPLRNLWPNHRILNTQHFVNSVASRFLIPTVLTVTKNTLNYTPVSSDPGIQSSSLPQNGTVSSALQLR